MPITGFSSSFLVNFTSSWKKSVPKEKLLMSQPTTVKKPDQQQQGEGRITAVRILGIGCRTAFQVQCWILLPCTGTEFWPAPCRYDTATQLAVESKRFSLRGFPSKNLQPPEFGNGVNFNIFSQIFMVMRLFFSSCLAVL
jgi:hypothetical protein